MEVLVLRKKFNKRSNSNAGNSRKRRSKRNQDVETKESTSMKEYESNDSSWYTGDSTLTFDAGRFNWYYPNGTLIDGILPSKFSFSGVLALNIVPGVGVSLGGDSVVNTAARKLYTWIRRSKSSYATYDPSDLMQYCIAMSQAYQFHNWMCRLYGFLNLYSQVNRYIPDTLLRANSINANALRSEMSDFLFYINKYGSQMGSLAAPATLPYFKRQAWLYSSVYTDDHSGKSTLFMYVPKGFYTYDEANAQLTWNALNFTGSGADLNAIVTLGDSIINSILQCQDFWNISADILNAYGNDILTVSPLPVDYLVLPTFDLEVLSQIQNTFICPEISVTQNANDITQDANGQLVYNPRIPMNSYVLGVQELLNKKDVIVNMYKDEVTPEDVFVATRMLPSFYTSSGVAYIDSCGTEICVGARIYYFIETGSGYTLANTNFNRFVNFGNYATTPVANDTNLGLVARLSQLSYHPHVYAFSLTNNSSGTAILDKIFTVGDVSNFTKMSPTDLQKLHTAALFSLFNVPTLGGFKG